MTDLSRIVPRLNFHVMALCQDNRHMNTIPRTAVAERSPNARRMKSTRSRVSNGRELFVANADGRSKVARRFKDVYQDLVEHAGGDTQLSEARRHLIKRAATLTVWSEFQEARLANGEPFDVAAYGSACNTLRRLLVDIGLDRALKDITPSLGTYLQAKRA